MNVGLGDAADEQHLRQPALTGGHGDGRHAGQRHPHVHRAQAAVVPAGHRRRRGQRLRRGRPAPPLPHVHRRADGRELQRRRSDVVALDRRPVHRQLHGVAALLRAGRSPIRSSRRRSSSARSACGGRRTPEAIGPSWRRTATRPSASSRATSSTPARAARRRSGLRSDVDAHGNRRSGRPRRQQPDVARARPGLPGRCGPPPAPAGC